MICLDRARWLEKHRIEFVVINIASNDHVRQKASSLEASQKSGSKIVMNRRGTWRTNDYTFERGEQSESKSTFTWSTNDVTFPADFNVLRLISSFASRFRFSSYQRRLSKREKDMLINMLESMSFWITHSMIMSASTYSTELPFRQSVAKVPAERTTQVCWFMT